MKRSIEAVPTWALNYIINGDAANLDPEEVEQIDDVLEHNDVEVVSSNGFTPYFSHYPWFGLPTEVEDCTIIYRDK